MPIAHAHRNNLIARICAMTTQVFSLSIMLCVAVSIAAAAVPADYSCPIVPAAGVRKGDLMYDQRPHVDGGAFRFINGQLTPYKGKTLEVTSPVYDLDTDARMPIGTLPDMDSKDALEALDAATAAWDQGQGEWPRMSLAARIAAIERFVEALRERRTELVNVLMWEICKSASDAAKEFDRTMEFIAATIAELKKDPTIGQGFSQWGETGGVGVRVRRGPIGVMLALAPFNYPLNEMYAILIPALLMGNVALLKLPAVGGLVHVLTAEAFQKHLPPGVINFVSGSGRATMGPIMQSGKVDVLGFIGGDKGADALISSHPHPHRLKVFAQLAAKNLGIVLPDADLDAAAEQVTLGATSYNGQRCTAIKLTMVHESVADAFVAKLVQRVAALRVGLPWDEKVAITPLPEKGKAKDMESLIGDALAQGAILANAAEGGGRLAGALMTPAVVDFVTRSMRLYHEEQFGPVVPVARFADVSQVMQTIKESWNGQQAAIFTADAEAAAPIVDTLSTVVGRININVQCGCACAPARAQLILCRHLRTSVCCCRGPPLLSPRSQRQRRARHTAPVPTAPQRPSCALDSSHAPSAMRAQPHVCLQPLARQCAVCGSPLVVDGHHVCRRGSARLLRRDGRGVPGQGRDGQARGARSGFHDQHVRARGVSVHHDGRGCDCDGVWRFDDHHSGQRNADACRAENMWAKNRTRTQNRMPVRLSVYSKTATGGCRVQSEFKNRTEQNRTATDPHSITISFKWDRLTDIGYLAPEYQVFTSYFTNPLRYKAVTFLPSSLARARSLQRRHLAARPLCVVHDVEEDAPACLRARHAMPRRGARRERKHRVVLVRRASDLSVASEGLVALAASGRVQRRGGRGHVHDRAAVAVRRLAQRRVAAWRHAILAGRAARAGATTNPRSRPPIARPAGQLVG